MGDLSADEVVDPMDLARGDTTTGVGDRLSDVVAKSVLLFSEASVTDMLFYLLWLWDECTSETGDVASVGRFSRENFFFSVHPLLYSSVTSFSFFRAKAIVGDAVVATTTAT